MKLQKKKKRTDFADFPRPGENYPYMLEHTHPTSYGGLISQALNSIKRHFLSFGKTLPWQFEMGMGVKAEIVIDHV